jgi:hypothetical protein
MLNYEVGCVLFIDDDNGVNGVGYSDGNGYFKVDNYKNLSDKIIWITNIKNDILNKNNIRHIKPVNFFGIKLDSLIYQLGLSSIQRKIVAKEICKLSVNTIEKLSENYNIKVGKSTLVENIIDNFNLKNLKYNDNDKILNIIKDNNSSFEITNLPQNKSELQLFLYYPRYEYNRNLCKIRFPKGDKWVHINRDYLKNKDEDWFNTVSKDYSFYALVKLTSINDDIKYLLPKGFTQSRVWINSVQYNLLKRFSKIYIDEIYINKNSMFLEEIERNKLFKLKSYEKGAISNGLAAYNYVNAFIQNNENSVMSNWINTYDKYRMLEVSMVFRKLNINVLSYGSGSILISIPSDKKNSDVVIKVCERLNLFYPMLLFNL